jgi:hypothetical protein
MLCLLAGVLTRDFLAGSPKQRCGTLRMSRQDIRIDDSSGIEDEPMVCDGEEILS